MTAVGRVYHKGCEVGRVTYCNVSKRWCFRVINRVTVGLEAKTRAELQRKLRLKYEGTEGEAEAASAQSDANGA
jgi:hypothetical protein